VVGGGVICKRLEDMVVVVGEEAISVESDIDVLEKRGELEARVEVGTRPFESGITCL
jgi:hypothetical protein